jgi:hypothetical protein
MREKNVYDSFKTRNTACKRAQVQEEMKDRLRIRKAGFISKGKTL